ncbi:MAG: hypothetical protein HeimC2_06660 [Candidatus Heimdallarchaeota archaeon LC_2]|nr:MAG: hypothetical protein HeimC2_06660 [Candidatus Heimdallarchaeota archaeon LC_2]
MKLDFTKMKLSGKGKYVTQPFEWVDDNFKLIAENTVFHEVLIEDNEEEKRIGWISPDSIKVQVDFTTHTNEGMIGESVHNEIKSFLIFDINHRFGQNLTQELKDVNSEECQALLNSYSHYHDETIFGNINLADTEDEGTVFILSIIEKLVFVQSPNQSIKIGDGGVYVLDREKESLTLITENDGITVIESGKSMVEINDKQHIRINGKEFDPNSIINHIAESISDAFSDFAL